MATKKKALSLAQLQTPTLKEVNLKEGVIYFAPPSAKVAMEYTKLNLEGNQESQIEKIAETMIDLIRDESNNKIFNSIDEMMEIPIDTLVEISKNFNLLIGGSADDSVPLEKTGSEEES